MTSSPFGNLFDKVKSSTKQAAEQMKLAGRIAALKVERSTQKAERDRLLKEIGSKTHSIFIKTGKLDSQTIEDEVTNELKHIQRIDKRLEEIDAEVAELQSELVKTGSEEIIDADEVHETEDKK